MLRIDGLKFSKNFVLCLAVGLAVPALAQEQQQALQSPQLASPVPVRVRHFEGVVTVQRASAGETSQAIPNLPLDAGDRVWTEEDGRAELTLSDGTTVWLDRRTTLDIVALDDGRGGSSILRLWGGSVLVWRPALSSLVELRLDNGENVVLLQHPGLARVDIDDERRLWLSVYDGQASLGAGGLVETIAAGEQSYTEPGTAPATASLFSTAEVDDFGQWQQQRWSTYGETTRYVAQRDYVPEEVRPYASELEAAGSWFYHDDFGSHAWRPNVAVGWSPYQRGRWVWGYGGWTWASSARWGWATSHYGRWHHLPSYGWVWFPGGGYRSAWVSWYVGYGYVGWSPIGYYGRPFISIGLWFGGGYGYGDGYHGRHNYRYPSQYGYGGRAVAERGYARDRTASPSGWTLVDAGDLPRDDSVRRAVSRTALPPGAAQNAATLSGPLRQRSISALRSNGQGVPPSAGARPRPGLSSGTTTSLGGQRAGSAPRPTLSGADVRGGPVRGRTAVRPGTAIGGRPADVSGVRPRPGGLSSGLSPARGTIRRPGTAARPGSRVGGLPSGAPRPTAGRSPASVRPGGAGRPSIERRPTSLRPSAGSRPGLGERPRTAPRGEPGRFAPRGEPGRIAPRGEPGRIAPRGEPGRIAPRGEPGRIAPRGEPGRIAPRGEPGRSSMGRGPVGPRVSAPRGAAPRGGGREAPRGGSRGGARRSGARRR